MTGPIRRNQAVVRAVQIATTLGVFYILWQAIDAGQALQILASAHPIWLIAALLALSAQTILSAIRWRITAAQLGLVLPLSGAIREYYLSQMVNQVLPGGVLGDAARAVRSRDQRGLLAASQAVIFERLAGQVALFVVMTGAIIVTVIDPNGIDWPAWAMSIVLLVILAGLALAATFALAALIPNPLQQKAKSTARSMARALLARSVIVAQVTLSFATVLCNLAAFAFCARAVGVVLSPIEVCALVPLILFTMLIPLTVTGWGLREGAAAAFLPLAGASAAAGLAASVAFGLTMLAASAPGLIVIWLRQRSAPNEDITA